MSLNHKRKQIAELSQKYYIPHVYPTTGLSEEACDEYLALAEDTIRKRILDESRKKDSTL